MLILADLIFKQNEAMWLAELIINAIYDQLMKLNFLLWLFLWPINSSVNKQKLKGQIMLDMVQETSAWGSQSMRHN